MCRYLVLGNGNIFIALDRYGQVREFYFPYVGSENHLANGCVHKIGVLADDQFRWLDDPGWEIDINYQPEALSSHIKARNPALNLELNFLDLAYNEKNIFLRKLTVKNLANRKRTIKIFFNQQFQIAETNQGNTAYYSPDDLAVIHYKSRRVFLISGRLDKKVFNDYSIGLFRIKEKEGTWKDAEDGLLSKNPIEHGSVDSVIAFEKTPDAEESFQIDYWITAGIELKEVKILNEYILSKNPDHLAETTQDFWRAWINKNQIDFNNLDEAIISLFKKSLLILRAHSDHYGGIIASGDADILQYERDTYSYVWPRDAAFAVLALDQAGYFDVTKRFFEFSKDVISDEGYFFHKYLSNKSLGSSWHAWIKNGKKQLPIQEDETALVLYAFLKHYEQTKDLEFIENSYNSLIEKAADFLCAFREKETKLPLPSYDLWEQKFGISTFTAAATAAALEAASRFAEILGKEKDQKKYSNSSLEIKDAIIKYLYNEKDGFFYKLVEMKDGKILHDNTIDISSAYGIFQFNILDLNDERLIKAFRITKEQLACPTNVGGMSRYQEDSYYKTDKNAPSNPWFISTLWLAQYEIAKSQNKSELAKAKEWLNWALKWALPSGVLSEQINALTGNQLSAGPLAWSHAEFVRTVVKYLEKLKEFKKD